MTEDMLEEIRKENREIVASEKEKKVRNIPQTESTKRDTFNNGSSWVWFGIKGIILLVLMFIAFIVLSMLCLLLIPSVGTNSAIFSIF